MKNKGYTEEEKSVFALASIGDIDSRNIIFNQNRALVSYVINRYFNFYTNIKEDLFQVGYEELLKLIPKFDISLGKKFSTYIVQNLYYKIRDYIKENQTVTINRYLKDIIIKINKVQNISIQKEEVEKTPSELASILNESEENISLALNAMNCCVSMNTVIYCGDDGQEIILEETLAYDSLIEEEYIEKETIAELRDFISQLPDDYRKIINLLYYDGKKQKEVAEILGFTQGAISNINKKCIKDFKKKLCIKI